MDWYKNHLTTIEPILSEWERLLLQALPERTYQTFLTKHAGLFMGSENCHLVISKLKLGSELETDFVTLTDGFSNGNLFELIEIKRPGTSLFTENGMVAFDFNRAIQQIRDWKRWLIDNRSWVSKFLPTISTRVQFNSSLKFKIVIGRQLTNPYDIEKRNQIANEIGAEIRSFDYLTDKLRTRQFYPFAWTENEPRYFEEELANPFYSATTDSKWKDFCKSSRVAESHFYSNQCHEVLKYRKYKMTS